ncbi:MAG: alpha/beta hydrolase [Thermoanaerobaculaceae bacterium]|jgi:pimeloyl-ACP methyl ester carboxylesterase|nr:alpha/beta hydrolase [Thermoanaerobaculaceae bacterium]
MRSFELAAWSCNLRFHDLPGRDPAILFVHGLGCASSCDYPRIAADPALAGRRMLLVDLLGFGFSDRPHAFGYTVEDHADTVSALVTGLGLSAVDVFGHSMGGAVAIVVAARNRQRVRSLVVSEPNLDAGGGPFSRPIAARPEADYVAGGHAESVRQAFADGHHIWAATLRAASPLAVHRGAVSLVRGGSPSWRELLETLPMPRTIVFGDRSLPDPDTERLPRSGVAVRIVPDAGHSMAFENPSGLAQALRDALGT